MINHHVYNFLGKWFVVAQSANDDTESKWWLIREATDLDMKTLKEKEGLVLS